MSFLRSWGEARRSAAPQMPIAAAAESPGRRDLVFPPGRWGAVTVSSTCTTSRRLAHAPGLARSCTQTLQRLASLAQPPGLARSCTHPASAALIRVLPPSP